MIFSPFFHECVCKRKVDKADNDRKKENIVGVTVRVLQKKKGEGSGITNCCI